MLGVTDNPTAPLSERIWDAYQNVAAIAVQTADAGDRARGAQLFAGACGVLALTNSWRSDMEPMYRAVAKIVGSPASSAPPLLTTPGEDEAYGRLAVLCIQEVAERSGWNQASTIWRAVFSDTPPWEMTSKEMASALLPQGVH